MRTARSRCASKPGLAAPLDSLVIRLLFGGIYTTDLELERGYYGFRGTPGHEFVGEVVEADDQRWIGERVVGEINLACGKCEWCARGLGRHCPRARCWELSSSPARSASSSLCPSAICIEFPREVPSEEAVFVEPSGRGLRNTRSGSLPAGTPVAVLGDGKLGLLASQVLQAHGAEVHQYGRHAEKLRIARQMGVSTELAKKLPVAKYEFVVKQLDRARASGKPCKWHSRGERW